RAISLGILRAIESVAIALAFEESAEGVESGGEKKSEKHQDQDQKGQSGRVLECRRAICHGLIIQKRRCPSQNKVNHPKTSRCQDHINDNQLGQMAMDMVPDLVSEHHVHLFGRELIHESVAQ